MQRFTEAVRLYQQGSVDQARLLCAKMLEQHTDSPQLQALYGATCMMSGYREQAQVSLARAVTLNPAHAPSWYLLGNLHRQSGDSQLAIDCYLQAVDRKPDFVDAMINLGLTYQESSSFPEAMDSYRRVLNINPAQPLALYNLGNLLQQLGQPAEAIACYRQALVINPRDIDVLFNLANALLAMGVASDALVFYEQVCEIDTAHAPALANKAIALRRMGRPRAALTALDAALAIDPGNATVLLTHGNVLFQLDHVDAAYASFKDAIRIDPGNADAYFNLGNLLCRCKRFSEAHQAYQKATALQPDSAAKLATLMGTRMALWDGDTLGTTWDQLQRVMATDTAAVVPMDMVLEFSDDLAFQQMCAQRTAREVLRKYQPAAVSILTGSTRGRYRIGYLSPDFGNHPVGLSLVEVLECADRSRFEIVGLSLKCHPDCPIRDRLTQACTYFHEIGELDHEQGVEFIRQLKLDIVVDLAGYTADHRAEYLAARVAPVQAGYLGYPGTLGAPWLDYLIADRYVIPERSFDHFDESIAWLPECFFPTDARVDLSEINVSRAREGLPEEAFVYCCFNSTKRISRQMLRVWFSVLSGVPNSVLWLQRPDEAAVENLYDLARECGVGIDRLVLARFAGSRVEHLARHRLADLYLDTFPYNSQSTARDALYAGLPVLTCSGRAYASRVAGSLLSALKLPELITDSLDEYQRCAVSFGTLPYELQQYREHLAQQILESTLFDSARLAQNLETLYIRMIDRLRAGVAPTFLDASDQQNRPRLVIDSLQNAMVQEIR